MNGGANGEDDFLEDYYDAVVLSTGLGSSILAAALAKSGRSVLHLDCNSYYGQESASFSFTQLLDWAEEHRGSGDKTDRTGEGTERPAIAAEFATSPAAESREHDPFLSTARKAIARGHARHELKQKRERLAAAASTTVATTAAPTREAEGEENPAANELTHTTAGEAGGDDGSEARGYAGAGKEKEDGAPMKAVVAGDKGDVLAAAGEEEEEEEEGFEVVEKPIPSMMMQGQRCGGDDSNGNGSSKAVAAESRGEQKIDETEGAAATRKEKEQLQAAKDEEEEKQAAKKQQELEDEKAIHAAAATRLASMAAHLLPLAYHGCRTHAGAPSDDCARERHAQKYADDAAAASGRFRRAPRPSHPAWIGRRAPVKDGGVPEGGGTREGDVVDQVHPSFWGYRAERRPSVADLVRLSRSFNLDLSSQVVLATGPAVDILVGSGVAGYLEFKDMQALYLASDVAGSTNGGFSKNLPAVSRKLEKPSSVGVQNSTKPLDSTKAAQPKLDQEARAHVSLSRVPCSKADIFGTKLLTPLEKRRLMRFLLFASDWGLQRAGEDVLARNEAGLGRGRSLRRPQNREAASGDFDADAYADKPFREFLESCGLPERVRAMIIHALALLPGGEVKEMGEEGDQCLGEATTDEGLEAVYRHLSALGRFGETAFITPLYGVGELPQAFCRMAAVYGAVYVLRRQLKGAVVDSQTGKCVGVIDETGRAFACGYLVVGAEYFTAPSTAGEGARPSEEGVKQTSAPQRSSPEAIVPTTQDLTDAREETNEVCPDLSVRVSARRMAPRHRHRLLRRVVLASGPVAPEGRGRGLCVLPPGLESVGNPAAIHVVSLDEATAACPGDLEGACVLQLTSTATALNDTPVASDVVQDKEDKEEGKGCQGNGMVDEDGEDGVLGRASRELLAGAGVEEIWSIGFSWDIQESVETDNLPANMVVCERPGQELYLHGAITEAERAFERLCPGEPFWPALAEPDNEDSDQAEMLRAAASTVAPSKADQG